MESVRILIKWLNNLLFSINLIFETISDLTSSWFFDTKNKL
jgi:hypothetical protein